MVEAVCTPIVLPLQQRLQLLDLGDGAGFVGCQREDFALVRAGLRAGSTSRWQKLWPVEP